MQPMKTTGLMRWRPKASVKAFWARTTWLTTTWLTIGFFTSAQGQNPSSGRYLPPALQNFEGSSSSVKQRYVQHPNAYAIPQTPSIHAGYAPPAHMRASHVPPSQSAYAVPGIAAVPPKLTLTPSHLSPSPPLSAHQKNIYAMPQTSVQAVPGTVISPVIQPVPASPAIHRPAPASPSISSTAFAQPYQGGISLSQSLSNALRVDDRVAAGRASVDEVRESYIQARAAGLPQIELSGSYGYTDTRTEFVDPNLEDRSSQRDVASVQAEITQSLFDGGRVRSQKKRAKASISAAEHQLRATKTDVLFDTSLAHLDILRDQRIVELYELSVANLQAQKQATHLLVQYGEGTQADIALVEARLKSVEVQTAEARLQLDTSLTNYSYLTGQKPQGLASPSPVSLPPSLQEAIQIAETNNPDLQMAFYRRDVAHNDLKIAKAAGSPTLSLRGGLSESTGESDLISGHSAATVSLNLRVPFSLGGQYRSQKRQATHALSRSELETRQTIEDVRRHVTLIWNNIHTAQKTLDLRYQEILSSQTAFTTLSEQFKAGVATQSELLSSEQALLDANINFERAKHNEQNLRLRFQAILGVLDSGNLAQAPSDFAQASHTRLSKTQPQKRRRFWQR